MGAKITARTKFYYWALVSLVNAVYFITMHALFGQTVGKMLMKIKVLDVSETPITILKAIVRNLPQIILLIGSFIFLDPLAVLPDEPTPESLEMLKNPLTIIVMIWSISDVICFFVTEKHRALHDFIAGTVVVRVNDDEI